MTPDTSQWLTVSEAASHLGVSVRAVQKRCKSGTLAARRIETPQGAKWEIDANQLTRTWTRTGEPGREAANEPANSGREPRALHAQNGANLDANSSHIVREPANEPDASSIQAITGDVARLSNEVEALKAFIAGGAMQAISERLAALPDAEALRAALAENQEQSAAMVAQAVEKGITAALQADTGKEAAAARLADEQNQKLLDAVARLSGEVEALREDREKKRGFFGRLFGGQGSN
jgi:hypothetical protein